MKIIEPFVEFIPQKDAKHHVATCARICYGKETGKDDVTINTLINKHHFSMFRHESIYAIGKYNNVLKEILFEFNRCPYIDYVITEKSDNGKIYISTNGNFIIDLNHLSEWNFKYKVLLKYIDNNKVEPEEFINTEIGFNLARYTFKVITQISISREFNRVSPNSIAERSTRYVYEDGSICRPHWLKGYFIYKDTNGKYIIYKDNKLDENINNKVYRFIKSCDNSFENYKYLVEAGLHRQDARGVLPLDTATICIYTYSIKEWRHILDLRYYGTTGDSHPNAKIIASMIRNELINLGYDFR